MSIAKITLYVQWCSNLYLPDCSNLYLPDTLAKVKKEVYIYG